MKAISCELWARLQSKNNIFSLFCLKCLLHNIDLEFLFLKKVSFRVAVCSNCKISMSNQEDECNTYFEYCVKSFNSAQHADGLLLGIVYIVAFFFFLFCRQGEKLRDLFSFLSVVFTFSSLALGVVIQGLNMHSSANTFYIRATRI